MATEGEEKVGYRLVAVRKLTLKNTDEYPFFSSIIICQDKIIVIDYNEIRLHRLHDVKFLTASDKLDSRPRDMCLMDSKEICVLHDDGLIKMMSIDSTDRSRLLKTTRTLLLHGVLDVYHGVLRFKDKLVVSGVRQDTMYWCFVSLDDGSVDTIHQICKGYEWSRVIIKDNIIYFSCFAGVKSSDNNGVYGFDILKSSICKYTYNHQRLQRPTSIVINEAGNIFVCNGFPDDSCIHQLTDSCQLVAIFTHEIPCRPLALFWDHGRLYVTRNGSREIVVLRPEYQEGLIRRFIRSLGRGRSQKNLTKQENPGSHTTLEVVVSDEEKHAVSKETAIRIDQGNVDEGQSSVVTEKHSFGPESDGSKDEKQDLKATVDTIRDERKELDIDGTFKQMEQKIVVEGQSSLEREKPSFGPASHGSKDEKQEGNKSREVKISDKRKELVMDGTSTTIKQVVEGQSSVERKKPSFGPASHGSKDEKQGDHKSREVAISDEGKEPVIDGTSTKTGQEIMIQRTVKESFNQEGNLMSTDDQGLFLKFQKKIGTALSFSKGPQTLIDAQTSHKATEMLLQEKRSDMKDSWLQYKTQGKLTPELIDVKNSQERNPKLHDKKDDILGQMPQFKLIVKARSSDENGENVQRILKRAGIQMGKEERDLFLRFQCEIGTILHLGKDPQTLIDVQKSIQATDIFIEQSRPDMKDAWLEYKSQGKLTPELIDVIYAQERNSELRDKKDYFLRHTNQLNIIVRARSFYENGVKEENYFFTSCMLRLESPKEVVAPEQDPRMLSTSDLCWVFTGTILPPSIFDRLLAACLSRWPVTKKRNTSKHLISYGCTVFDLDLTHRLTLNCKNNVVYARITWLVIDNIKTPNAKLCTRVRKFITQTISSKITDSLNQVSLNQDTLNQNLQYELCLQSQESFSDDARIRLIPFQMWIEDEVHDPDSPIKPEHMNHARLCVALVTVCGKALREMLLDHFPVPYTDIYQAILANRAKLTGRQGRAVLNQDQIKLVFPDPQMQKTGTVEMFDLSLLYTLIRNVSTVQAPVTGWGNIPQPRDNSLGASVERIRSYRNHISGHSPDAEITHQDFEDYWKKIENVLRDIEVVINKNVYSTELERQKRQVISVFDAC